jgi:hypothetical protein
VKKLRNNVFCLSSHNYAILSKSPCLVPKHFQFITGWDSRTICGIMKPANRGIYNSDQVRPEGLRLFWNTLLPRWARTSSFGSLARSVARRDFSRIERWWMPPPSSLYSLICVLEGVGRAAGHAARIKVESHTASVSACAGTTATSRLHARPGVGNTTATRR